MKAETSRAVAEQVETLKAQADNAAKALVSGDIDRLAKALSIIEKVCRIVLVVVGALGDVKVKK